MSRRISRRWVLGAGAALTALAPLSRASFANRSLLPQAGAMSKTVTPHDVALVSQPRQVPLLGPNKPASTLWTFNDDYPTIIRIPRGTPLRARLTNRLKEHTSIHWHGLRIDNAMDGVPYMTQAPVEEGESFTYEFLPPDTGTFFFHPHCNTIEQLGRGLAGVLIVEGDAPAPYAADLVCALKDWRLDTETGGFIPFLTDRGASRNGTFGTLRTANAAKTPTLTVPPDADIRLRLLNLDVSRISDIAVEGGEAAIIAIDGNAVAPFPLSTWRLGPAMRVDLAIRTPPPGKQIQIIDYFAPAPLTLATLQCAPSASTATARTDFDPVPLYAPAIPKPDLANAIPLRFVFAAATGSEPQKPLPTDIRLPDGEIISFADVLCLSDRTYWTINQQSWPEDGHQAPPPPLANLELGKTYQFDLINNTPHQHPIHIHGHTFLVLGSNKRPLPRHYADTVLLAPKERIKVAFVADNPGNWMFHCHIIEHQDTGMMGFVRVA